MSNTPPIGNQSTSACGGVGYVPVPPRLWSRAGGNNCPGGGYSTYELDQRRKAEILKYKGNSAQLSRAQQYSMASRNALTRKKSWATQTQTYTNPNVDNLPEIQSEGVTVSLQCNGSTVRCSLTSDSDVPGPVIPLCIDESVPLYNYKLQVTPASGGTGIYNLAGLMLPPTPAPTPNPVKYVGVGSQPSFASSGDGINWTSSDTQLFQIAEGVAYNPSSSRWVAVGGIGTGGVGGGRIAYSDNGTTWTLAQIGTMFSNCNGVAYAEGRWVVVGEGSNYIAYSDNDGVTWTPINNPDIVGSMNAVAYNSVLARWIAVGLGNIAYSDNGTVWTRLPNSISILSEGNGIACSGTRWVAVGDQAVVGSATQSTIVYSNDNGVTWNLVPNSRNTIMDQGYCVAYNASSAKKWIAGGAQYIAYSDDGENWTRAWESNTTLGTNPNENIVRSVAYNGGLNRWVALGDGNQHTSVYSNNGGLTWVLNGRFWNAGYGVAASSSID